MERQLKQLVTETRSNTERDEPKRATPNTLSEDPHLVAALELSPLPQKTKSSTDNADAKRTHPKEEQELPTLASARVLKPEPKFRRSKIEQPEANLPIPYREIIAWPKRALALKLTADPHVRKSKTLAPEPKAATP
jgi:hypothetical protein